MIGWIRTAIAGWLAPQMAVDARNLRWQENEAGDIAYLLREARDERDAAAEALRRLVAERPGHADPLYYLRSIYRNLTEISQHADVSVRAQGYGLADEALADNRDWLDCFIDQIERARAALPAAPTEALSTADEAQMALCQLAWIKTLPGVHPRRVECIRLALERLAGVAAAPTRRVRHKKRGSICAVLGEAEVQLAKPMLDVFTPTPFRPLREGDKLTVYEHDGKLWCRFTDEFEDGRFEDLPPAPEPK